MVTMQKNIRPPFSTDDVPLILQQHYRIQAQTISELTAELDRNFYICDEHQNEYVLKIAHHSLTSSVLDLQNQALKHIAKSYAHCPQLIPTLQNADMAQIQGSDGQGYDVRLLNYLLGVPLVDFRPHSTELLHDIGTQLGQLSSAIHSLEHEEKRLDYRWNLLNLLDLIPYADDMPDEKQAVIQHFAAMYQQKILPHLDTIRHSFIYNDANDYNILIQLEGMMGNVSGFIDFGDMVYAPTIAELAVALAYLMMDKDQPLDTAATVIRAYHAEFPLTEQEIAILYTLITARLCMSVCISWYQQKQEPDNPHLSISEDAAWRLLFRLRETHPDFAHYVFRDACGLPANPATEQIEAWLKQYDAFPVLGKHFDTEHLTLLDLSVGSTELGNVDDFADTKTFTDKLFSRLGDEQVGVGKYNEVRPIYLGEKYAVSHHERRTVHIGVDLFAEASTAIFAPLDAIVHSLQDNGSDNDYGPALILEHHPQEDIKFYTLYGHLDAQVLDDLQVGQHVNRGQQIALMGDYPQNGDWSPHLHFQVITDILDYVGDFPGVVSPRSRDVWLSLSPDPNLILKLPFDIVANSASTHEQNITARRKTLNPSMSISYQQPLKILRAYMHHLYDENGQAYLDCVNNVPHVGHSNPRVVQAAQKQIAVLNTNTRYLHDNITMYAERLCATLPESLSVCFLVNSGSEANELAVRLAKAYTGGTDFVVIDHAYHGNTSTLIDLSPYKFNGAGGAGKPDYVEIADMPDGYRGEYRGFDQIVGGMYAQSVQGAIERIQVKGHSLAGFFSEGILGCGGQMTLPDGYLAKASEFIHAAGGVVIADEVQIGFGRVGTHFWAFETQAIVPDIVTMGKPIGNGHPMAAVVTTREIADAFNNGMEYFNTFGGNPVSCAIGLEVLNIIEDEQLQHNALTVGNYLMDRLRDLQTDYPVIGHVRGSGLFIGVELIRNTETLEAADVETSYIVKRMKGKGFLLSTEGPLHNVLKIKPPIIFKKEHVDLFIDALEDILKDSVLMNITR